jgi:chromate transporter
VLLIPTTVGQVFAMLMGAIVGGLALHPTDLAPAQHHDYGVSKRWGLFFLSVLIFLLFGLPILAEHANSLAITAVATFYKAGALVFGGGHVVLPLLQAGVVPNGLIGIDVFLAGYGIAQAVPGPLFTFAAYLGAVMPAPLGGWLGGLLLLGTIFLPAFLLVFGALPFWEVLRQRQRIQKSMAGVNAAVVGILGAALYDPVWTSAIHARADFAIALAAFGLLVLGRQSPVLVVTLSALAGWLMAA